MGFFDNVGNWFKQAGKSISGAVQSAVHTIERPFKDAGKQISGATQQFSHGIQQAFKSTGKFLAGAEDKVEGVFNFVGKQIDKFTTTGSEVAKNISGGLGNLASGVGTGVENTGSNLGYIAAAGVGLAGVYLLTNGGQGSYVKSNSKRMGTTLSNCRVSKKLAFA